ncbi:MAG: corrinoid protein [Anaerolineaceae bacterium]|jgi:5-methyltetrahydrofolate--homocysteine methyltransferase
MDEELSPIFQGILEGDSSNVKENIQKALDAHVEPAVVLNDGMIAAMAEVGRLFEEGEYYVPEMLISARAMQSGLTILRPYLVQAKVRSAGKVVIGTVQGDLHDIGKNLVSMMLEGSGFEVIDLGTDVSAEKFVVAAETNNAQLVAMSALLTTTMPRMKDVIAAFKDAGMRDKIKVMIGGAPITQKYATDIGADGFAPDASRAAAEAKKLMSPN